MNMELCSNPYGFQVSDSTVVCNDAIFMHTSQQTLFMRGDFLMAQFSQCLRCSLQHRDEDKF